jgi:hypothetical protein
MVVFAVFFGIVVRVPTGEIPYPVFAYRIPRWHLEMFVRYAKKRLRRQEDYFPVQWILTQIRGDLAGPWSLWRSRRRVKREGRSKPYYPTSPRHDAAREGPEVPR